ncbi:hypothetical protein GCM10010172_28040 [Paractinoplanes ferrugineus]|uniref:Uncharacterized protein n=1 Tax=Paractinoplanes ferrugineus TaxID=113564 RepID=A0A919J0G5_9ACTN|nr:hypothetical protein [Actinoplanes ferrugineus]GIE08286.1 hypothetical protein Afe05nite_01260 [Actinoplanes ferrugineus]
MAGPNESGGWSPDDLPDLPEEWGVIVIPDDLSELSDEVDAIRAELREIEHPSRWQQFLNRPGMRQIRKVANGAVRAPVLIITLAILVTVASLFASAWPGPTRQPAAQRTASTTATRAAALPALELVNADGQAVSLRHDLPAVILLIDGCECDTLIADTIAAVRPEIVVITVAGAVTAAASAGTAPPTGAAPQAQGKTVRVLHDPSGTVRTQLKVGAPDGTAAALLVDKAGVIIRTDARTASVDTFRPDLARL